MIVYNFFKALTGQGFHWLSSFCFIQQRRQPLSFIYRWLKYYLSSSIKGTMVTETSSHVAIFSNHPLMRPLIFPGGHFLTIIRLHLTAVANGNILVSSHNQITATVATTSSYLLIEKKHNIKEKKNLHSMRAHQRAYKATVSPAPTSKVMQFFSSLRGRITGTFNNYIEPEKYQIHSW